MIALSDILLTVAKSERYSAEEFRLLFLSTLDPSVKLPPRLLDVAEIISQDQGRLDERFERRKQLRAERNKRYRETHETHETRKTAQDAKDAKDAHLPSCLPSCLPNNKLPPTPLPPAPNAPSGAAAVSLGRRSRPNLEQVLSKARQLNIPEEFARQFFADMEADGWVYKNRAGNTATVDALSFAATMRARWNARDKMPGKRAGSRPGVYHQDGYEYPED